MSFFRNLRWKLADRFPAFDSKDLYYRPQRPRRIFPADEYPRPRGLSAWDQLLIALLSMVLIAIGAFGLFIGGFVLWIIFTV